MSFQLSFYHLQLLFTDPSDKPLADTKSEVEMTADSISVFKETVISDKKGMAYFTVKTIPSGAKYVGLRVSNP